MKRFLTIAAAASAVATGAIAAEPSANADMAGPNGSDMGRVEITQGPNGTLFHIEAKGLAEGWHGFHVHETGSCDDALKAAGGHYAPAGNEHGLLNEAGAHAGDLPNIYADATGMARAEVFSSRLSVSDGDAPLMDDDGSAIVIHAKGDTYESDPEAGGRKSCGVVKAAQ